LVAGVQREQMVAGAQLGVQEAQKVVVGSMRCRASRRLRSSPADCVVKGNKPQELLRQAIRVFREPNSSSTAITFFILLTSSQSSSLSPPAVL